MRLFTWTQKLQAKATFLVIGTVAVALIVGEVVERAYVTDLARKNLELRSISLLRQIHARIQTDTQFHNEFFQKDHLKNLVGGIPDLQYIGLYEASPQSRKTPFLRVSLGEKSDSSKNIPGEVSRAFATQEPVSTFQEVPLEHRIKVALPVTSQGGMAGVLYAEYWTGQFETFIKFYHRWSLIIRVGVGAILVVAINGFMYYGVLRPLSIIRKGVAAVARNDWNTQLALQTKDELGEMASDLNAMVSHISQVMKENQTLNDELRRSHQYLQHRVDDATKELVQRNEQLALLNEQLASAQREALQYQRLAMLGQLVATIAHKVGTPLTAISGHLQLMLETPNLLPEVTKRVHTLLHQTDRLSKVIQDLLSLARTPTIKKEPVPLIPLIEQLCTMFKPVCDQRGIELITECMPSVSTILADAFALQEILGNLVDNAIDVMPKGGRLSLRVFQDTSDSPQMVIEVTDTGPGISQEHRQHIFDPFYTTKGMGQGTGLGLAITLELVKLHGGSLAVRSEEGRGTTFTITFPA